MIVSAVTLLAGIIVWTAFVIDRTDSEKQEAQESARRLASIVTSSNEAIIGKTLDGIVTSWNPAAEAIYGYSAEEMIGHSLTMAIPPDRLDEFQSISQKSREASKCATSKPCGGARTAKLFMYRWQSVR